MEKVTMEGREKVGSSSSFSFTSELFRSKESPPSSGIFGAIFSPSSKVPGRESVGSEIPVKNQGVEDEPLNNKPGFSDGNSNNSESEVENITNSDMSAIYEEQRVHPCHLSSSIYYGGQDFYCHPQCTQNPGPNSRIMKDGGEDDSGFASRGNWWQGSLYY